MRRFPLRIENPLSNAGIVWPKLGLPPGGLHQIGPGLVAFISNPVTAVPIHHYGPNRANPQPTEGFAPDRWLGIAGQIPPHTIPISVPVPFIVGIQSAQAAMPAPLPSVSAALLPGGGMAGTLGENTQNTQNTNGQSGSTGGNGTGGNNTGSGTCSYPFKGNAACKISA